MIAVVGKVAHSIDKLSSSFTANEIDGKVTRA